MFLRHHETGKYDVFPQYSIGGIFHVYVSVAAACSQLKFAHDSPLHKPAYATSDGVVGWPTSTQLSPVSSRPHAITFLLVCSVKNKILLRVIDACVPPFAVHVLKARDDADRFRVEILFSPGVVKHPLLPGDHLHTAPLVPLHKNLTSSSLEGTLDRAICEFHVEGDLISSWCCMPIHGTMGGWGLVGREGWGEGVLIILHCVVMRPLTSQARCK